MHPGEQVFGDLLLDTWRQLDGFDAADLGVLDQLEQLLSRAPSELGELLGSGQVDELSLLWLSLPYKGAGAIAQVLRRLQALEGSERHEPHRLALRAAGLRLQAATTAAAKITVERMDARRSPA